MTLAYTAFSPNPSIWSLQYIYLLGTSLISMCHLFRVTPPHISMIHYTLFCSVQHSPHSVLRWGGRLRYRSRCPFTVAFLRTLTCWLRSDFHTLSLFCALSSLFSRSSLRPLGVTCFSSPQVKVHRMSVRGNSSRSFFNMAIYISS